MQMKFKTMLSILFFILFQQQCFSLSIGTIAEPPGNFEDKDGNITGLSVDFVKEIQKRVNNNSPIQMLPGTRLIYNSLKKKDYVVFSLSKNKRPRRQISLDISCYAETPGSVCQKRF